MNNGIAQSLSWQNVTVMKLVYCPSVLLFFGGKNVHASIT